MPRGEARREVGPMAVHQRRKTPRPNGKLRVSGAPLQLEDLRSAWQRWEAEVVRPTIARRPERAERFTTLSEIPVERLYSPLDRADHAYLDEIGFPGQYPFTRGIYPTMYR